MSKINFSPITKAKLLAYLDSHKVKIELEGQYLTLTFCTLRGLKRFRSFYQSCKPALENIFGKKLNELKIDYYLHHEFIGQSSPAISSNWVGKYMGEEHLVLLPKKILKIYFKNLFGVNKNN